MYDEIVYKVYTGRYVICKLVSWLNFGISCYKNISAAVCSEIGQL